MILHLQSLLDGRLHYEGSVRGNAVHLMEQLKALCSGADFITLELLRLRTLAPVSCLPLYVHV